MQRPFNQNMLKNSTSTTNRKRVLSALITAGGNVEAIYNIITGGPGIPTAPPNKPPILPVRYIRPLLKVPR